MSEKIIRDYFDAILNIPDGTTGWLIVAVARGQHLDGNGKYSHSSWREHPFRWPAQADEAIALIEREAPTADVFVCPYLQKDKHRAKGNAAWRQLVHCDVDEGRLDLDRVHGLGGFAVRSGSPGNGHVYIPLKHPVIQAQHEILCRGLAVDCGGDRAKISDNDVLRPPTALNHKAACNGGQPTPVELVGLQRRADGGIVQVDPFALAKALNVDISNIDGTNPPAQASSQVAAEQPVDLDAYPQVEEALALVTDPADRSKDTYRIAAVCAENGLSLEQTRWVINQRPDLAGRLAGRKDDDIRRAQKKIHTKQRKRKAQKASTAPKLDDAHIGPHIADRYLARDYLYSGAFGWMRFDGRRWKLVDEAIVAEVVRRAILDLFTTEMRAGADADRLKAIAGLFSLHRMSSVQRVARNYLARDGEDFDAHPHLLNVSNGVVDLRDGTLHAHDSKLLFTRVTMTDYHCGATHLDWNKALTAITLEEAKYLRVRFGQGLTGYPPSDDILVVLKGAGENGKSTIIDGVRGASGVEYAIPLPDRVLLATPGQHPTELMELRDARLAFMEEFPELGHLNVKRLKDLTGTEYITARYCGKDSVKWKGTHTIFVTTNYTPRVDESDHGTWRRLAMVDFPHRYRKPGEAIEGPNDRPGDPGLRERMRAGEDGQHEAVLAWLVEGAVEWYRNGKTMPQMPASIVETTAAWRRSSDLMLRFIDDVLIFDHSCHVMSADLYANFVAWLKEHGHVTWTDQSFSARFGQHPAVIAKNVTKKIIRPSSRQPNLSRPESIWDGTRKSVPERYTAWLGARFRTAADNQGNTP